MLWETYDEIGFCGEKFRECFVNRRRLCCLEVPLVCGSVLFENKIPQKLPPNFLPTEILLTHQRNDPINNFIIMIKPEKATTQ
jgi:hypothetical protein